jgi:diguanylate cyclase (GGDEF)-like protein
MDTQQEVQERRTIIEDPIRTDQLERKQTFEARLMADLAKLNAGLIKTPDFIKKYGEQFENLDKKAEMGIKDDLLGEHGFYRRNIFLTQMTEALNHLRELKKQGKDVKSLAIALIDVDDFKNVNTLFGYQGGDAILKGVAERTKETTRESDVLGRNNLLGRQGGDEMVVGLFDVDEHGASIAGERISAAVSGQDFKLPDGRLHHQTISIGLVVATDEDTPQSLFRKASQAVFNSKNEKGKNAITLWTPELEKKLQIQNKQAVNV